MAILIISAIIMLLIIFKSKFKSTFNSFLYSLCFIFLYLYISTEALSLFNKITEKSILVSWIVINVALFITMIITLKKHKLKLLKEIKKKINKVNIIFIILSIMLINLSINTVPYNWDSMTYHLSRIMHWSQNGSINHYATNIIRQITSPIMAEVAMMHIYLLSGSNDNFVNLLQTFSLIFNCIIVYNISIKIGCNKKFAYLSMLLAFSMPIGFAESLSTQVDNFAALWCLVFTYLILEFCDKNTKLKFEKENIIKLICLGISLALGYMSKPTILFSCGLFTLYLFIICIIRKDKINLIIKSILIVMFSTLIIITPNIIRNLKTFNAISDPIAGSKQVVHTNKVNYFYINFIKNLYYNFPVYIIKDGDQMIYDHVKDLAESLNVNIDDESISEGGLPFKTYESTMYHHDYAINPIILWSISIGIIMYIIVLIKSKFKLKINIYTLISILSFLIFIATMRFQVWGTRYEISFLCLLCPAIALIYNNVFKNVSSQSVVIGIIICLCSISLYNQFYYHSKLFEEDQARKVGYFKSGGPYNAYNKISEYINKNKFKNIGIEIEENSYEYPLWTMIKGYKRIEHINVENVTNRYYDYSYIPDAIITLKQYNENKLSYNDNDYELVYSVDNFNLFVKE